jgi:hypothetical protein
MGTNESKECLVFILESMEMMGLVEALLDGCSTCPDCGTPLRRDVLKV